jgi:hypothetical protein
MFLIIILLKVFFDYCFSQKINHKVSHSAGKKIYDYYHFSLLPINLFKHVFKWGKNLKRELDF